MTEIVRGPQSLQYLLSGPLKKTFADPAPGSHLLVLSCCCHLSTIRAPGCFSPHAMLLPSPTHSRTISPWPLAGPLILRMCDKRKGPEAKAKTTF